MARRRSKRDRISGPRYTPAAGRRAARRRINQEDINLEEEYAYVISDLRRIFILAAAMFVLLIAANLMFQFI